MKMPNKSNIKFTEKTSLYNYFTNLVIIQLWVNYKILWVNYGLITVADNYVYFYVLQLCVGYCK